MRFIPVQTVIIIQILILNVVICSDGENVSLATNQTTATLKPHSNNTTSINPTTTVLSEEPKKKKKHHHHHHKKKHKKHKKHHNKSEDIDLTNFSTTDNTPKITSITAPLNIISPTNAHSIHSIFESKLFSTSVPPLPLSYYFSLSSYIHTTITASSISSTNIQQPHIPSSSPTLKLTLSDVYPTNTDITPIYTDSPFATATATMKLKTSSMSSLLTHPLPTETPTPVSGFPFVQISVSRTTSPTSKSITHVSVSPLKSALSHFPLMPTHYVVPSPDEPKPQENMPGNQVRGSGDPNEFRNHPVGLNSTNRDIGLGLGIGIAGFAGIILLGLLVQRYKQKRNNKNDLGIYFSEKDSHKSMLSNVSTKWRPNSFIGVVASTVSRIPSKEDSIVTYPPELYSPIKASYHDSIH